MTTYCERLGIAPPDLAALARRRDANHYALLIAALLEHGAPMTLPEVAARLEAVDIAPAEAALASLKKCKPARGPVFRDGDRYALDVRHAELEFLLLRLELRPRPAPSPTTARDVPPLPGPEHRLTPTELDEALPAAMASHWSDQRLALAVLDAHHAPMTPTAVADAVRAHGRSKMRLDPARCERPGSAIAVLPDGRWDVRDYDAVVATRKAVRAVVAERRRRAAASPDQATIDASIRRAEERRRAHAAELAALRRAVVHTFPATEPAFAVVLDAQQRSVRTFAGAEFAAARAAIATFQVLAGLDVRATLRGLGVDHDAQVLAELGPPQKTRKLNRQGRTLKITAELLIRGSCGISQPLGDPQQLAGYLANGDFTRLRRRLEADAKSLFALYEFGRLHSRVRLHWGFLDEWLAAPWVHLDEPCLYTLMQDALADGAALEVVAGSAPGWAEPWARAQRCTVRRSLGNGLQLVDARGVPIYENAVQLARRTHRRADAGRGPADVGEEPSP